MDLNRLLPLRRQLIMCDNVSDTNQYRNSCLSSETLVTQKESEQFVLFSFNLNHRLALGFLFIAGWTLAVLGKSVVFKRILTSTATAVNFVIFVDQVKS